MVEWYSGHWPIFIFRMEYVCQLLSSTVYFSKDMQMRMAEFKEMMNDSDHYKTMMESNDSK